MFGLFQSKGGKGKKVCKKLCDSSILRCWKISRKCLLQQLYPKSHLTSLLWKLCFLYSFHCTLYSFHSISIYINQLFVLSIFDVWPESILTQTLYVSSLFISFLSFNPILINRSLKLWRLMTRKDWGNCWSPQPLLISHTKTKVR